MDPKSLANVKYQIKSRPRLMLRRWKMKFQEAGGVWLEAALLYRDAIERGRQKLNWPSGIEFSKALVLVWERFLLAETEKKTLPKNGM